jgi:hypothetical protein
MRLKHVSWLAPVGAAVLDVLSEGAKSWIQGVAAEHAKRYAERRWGPAPEDPQAEPVAGGDAC